MKRYNGHPGIPEELTGGRSYEEMKRRFMELFLGDGDAFEIRCYSSPELYHPDRVTYIIPPITDAGDRDSWKPANMYLVKDGIVAVGRVFYTRTSGEYLIEELILHPGDIFGEFEVPLSIFGDSNHSDIAFPPRFNMTYGAWASGPALNWAMAYPRQIPRDDIAPANARAAVHPFYIKSKNIRPETNAEVVVIPIERFEAIVSEHPEAMTWFLLNVLKKTRLYFEPPSPGYSRSPSNLVARLIIRILAYRIRLGIVVRERIDGNTTCRTFIGPTEWIKFGLGAYMADIREIIQSTGGKSKEAHVLPVFAGRLADILEVTYHCPVKDLDDAMLAAMGCSPAEDRRENRYGLLTGMKIELRDLDAFTDYLRGRGE
ncbi:MAG: hypothetical protein J7M24_03205 [Candidatus Latescibacteria bacterium]|nr:hypothetical protein [Candidatus Latescibacterota bacterium]